ncbi:hypothetical protein AYI69_g10535 [Smittium culicis]|uniref:Uncharacterized protein n=1 Tax=Smittium culicis TaxID=133412 RepID=A0A1R1X526_9FUNG|nr:hypothetical protein AYI69_g10535 [Smittium culicis]
MLNSILTPSVSKNVHRACDLKQPPLSHFIVAGLPNKLNKFFKNFITVTVVRLGEAMVNGYRVKASIATRTYFLPRLLVMNGPKNSSSQRLIIPDISKLSSKR